MKTPYCSLRSAVILAAVLISALGLQPSTCFAQGTAFTYQGRLTDNGNPANGSYLFRFSLDEGNGIPVGSPVTTPAVGVSNGLFTVTLDFGAGIFTGDPRRLLIEVRTNDNGSSFVPLTPPQPLLPTPYAIFAAGANAAGITGIMPTGALSGVYSSPLILTNAGNQFAGNGGGLTNVNAARLGGLSASNFWQTSGNAGTTPGVNFLGTTDNQPLELKVNGGRVLRLEPTASSPNVIGGYVGNFTALQNGVVIGGGGQSGSPNTVSGSFATIGGGQGNNILLGAHNSVIAGGAQNSVQSFALDASIGGGSGNIVGASGATIGGGVGNLVTLPGGTIAGGHYNEVASNSRYGTISGGLSNRADGLAGTVAGGLGNVLLTATYVQGENHITNTPHFAAILGGATNRVSGLRGSIAGGHDNFVHGEDGNISGGHGNVIGAPDVESSTTFDNFIGAGLGNTILGRSSAIIGGANNRLGGDNSAILAGDSNRVDHTYSVAAGERALSRLGHSSTLGGGGLGGVGSAQGAQYVLTIQASGTNAALLSGPAPPLNGAIAFTVLICAKANGNSTAAFEVKGSLRNYGGSVDFTGAPVTPSVTVIDQDGQLVSSTVDAKIVGGSLAFEVHNGSTAVNARWVAVLQTCEVQF